MTRHELLPAFVVVAGLALFVQVGSGAFTLTVDGSNFVTNSVVRWNGSDRPTTIVSATQLIAQITAGHMGMPFAGNNSRLGVASHRLTRPQSAAVMTLPVGSTNHRSLLNGLPLRRATSQSATRVGGKGPRLAAGTLPTECRLSA